MIKKLKLRFPLVFYYFALAALQLKLVRCSQEAYASIGSRLVFNPSGTADASLLRLPENQFVLKFKQVGGSGTLAALTVSDGTLSLGGKNKFNAALPKWSIDALMITSTSVLVAFRNDDSKKHGIVAIATVAPEGDIQMSEEFTFHHEGTDHILALQLTQGRIVFVFSDESNDGRSGAVVGLLREDEVSFGDKVLFGVRNVAAVSALPVSTDRFVVVMQGPPDYYNGQGAVAVGTVKDGTVSFGPSSPFGSTYPRSIVVCQLSSETFVVAFRETDAWSGNARVGIVKNGLVEFGGVAVFSSDRTDHIRLVQHGADSMQILVAYSTRKYSAVRVGTVDGNRLSFAADTHFAAEVGRIDLLGLSATLFIVSYEDVNPTCEQEVFASRGWTAVGSVDNNGRVVFGPGTLICDSIGEISSARVSDTEYLVAYEDRGSAGNGVIFHGKVGNDHGAGTGVVNCPEEDPRKHDEQTLIIVMSCGIGFLFIALFCLGVGIMRWYKRRYDQVSARPMTGTPVMVSPPSTPPPPPIIIGESGFATNTEGTAAEMQPPTRPAVPVAVPMHLTQGATVPATAVPATAPVAVPASGVSVSCPKCRIVSNPMQWQTTYIESQCPVCLQTLNLIVAPCGHGVCSQCMEVLRQSATNHSYRTLS